MSKGNNPSGRLHPSSNQRRSKSYSYSRSNSRSKYKWRSRGRRRRSSYSYSYSYSYSDESPPSGPRKNERTLKELIKEKRKKDYLDPEGYARGADY